MEGRAVSARLENEALSAAMRYKKLRLKVKLKRTIIYEVFF